MLLARAFVFGVSARALLAVAAVAVSVIYALVAAGSLSGLGGEGAALEEAETDAGYVLISPQGGALADDLPAGATMVDVAERDGIRLATMRPWPYEPDRAFQGPYAASGLPNTTWTAGWNVTEGAERFQPWDTYLVSPDSFAAAFPQRGVQAVAAYIPGDTDPGAGAIPWRGIGSFYEGGADQIRANLFLVVIASGVIASFLSSGFVRLEVLARRADLDTIASLAGERVVRRLVRQRAAVLATVGVLLGVAVAFIFLRVLSSAVGLGTLSVPLPVLVAVVLAAGLGSALTAGLVGVRSLQASRGGSGGKGLAVRRYPGPVRFLFVTPRLFPASFAATLVTVGILSVVLASSAAPATLFGNNDGTETVLFETDGNPLRGRADRFLGETARHIEGVDQAMPETFAPTVLDGRPIMVKGIDLDAWRDYRAPRLVDGAWPSAEGEATIGTRAMRVHEVQVGDVVHVPASYHIGYERLHIVGVHDTGDLEDDQLLTDLTTAGRMAGLRPDQVSMVRIRVADPNEPWSSLAPGPGVQVLDVSIIPDDPVPLTPATVQIHVANFGPSPAERALTVRLNGNLSARLNVHLEGHTHEVHQVPVVVPAGDRLRLEVNPTREVSTRNGGLTLFVPEVARPDAPFEVRVERSGEPAVGAAVLVDGAPAGTTDGTGTAEIIVSEARLVAVSAEVDGLRGGALVRVAPEEWDDAAHLVAERISFGTPTRADETRYRLPIEASVVNLGGRAFEGNLSWTADGETIAERAFELPSGFRTRVTHEAVLDHGEHFVGLLGLEARSEVTAADVERPAAGGGSVEDERPATVEELLTQRAAAKAAGSGADHVRVFLDQVFATMGAATVLVVIATFLHAGGLVWVAVVREVRERRDVVTAVQALGASTAQLQARVGRDTVLSLLPGVVAGAVVAAAALTLLAQIGFPAAFGHTLPVDLSLGLLVRIGIGLVVIGLAAALYALQSTRPRGPAAPRKRPLATIVRELR